MVFGCGTNPTGRAGDMRKVDMRVLPDLSRPPTPAAPSAQSVMEAPCAFPASVSYDDQTNTLIATCGGNPNALFRSPQLDSPNPGKWTEIGYAQGYPSHHIPLDHGFYLINHSVPDGFTIINESTGGASSTVTFSNLTLYDTNNNRLPFILNNPSGAVLIGSLICVAPSSLDITDFNDPAKTTYHQGAMLCMQYSGNGSVNTNTAKVHYPLGQNLTGMALVDSQPGQNGTQRFAVLASNNYAPDAGSHASLYIYTFPGMIKRETSLGPITAQAIPTLAILQEGMAVIAVQGPQPGVRIIDANAGTVTDEKNLPEVTNFPSSVNIYGTAIAVSDSGKFGDKGSVVFFSSNSNGWIGTVVTTLDGNAGPSVIVEHYLYQVVAQGNKGTVVRIDLSQLE